MVILCQAYLFAGRDEPAMAAARRAERLGNSIEISPGNSHSYSASQPQAAEALKNRCSTLMAQIQAELLQPISSTSGRETPTRETSAQQKITTADDVTHGSTIAKEVKHSFVAPPHTNAPPSRSSSSKDHWQPDHQVATPVTAVSDASQSPQPRRTAYPPSASPSKSTLPDIPTLSEEEADTQVWGILRTLDHHAASDFPPSSYAELWRLVMFVLRRSGDLQLVPITIPEVTQSILRLAEVSPIRAFLTRRPLAQSMPDSVLRRTSLNLSMTLAGPSITILRGILPGRKTELVEATSSRTASVELAP